MNDIETKIRERNGKLYSGSVWNDKAIMRYMVMDYPETVFSTKSGYCKLGLPKDSSDHDNDGGIIAVRIGPFRPPQEKYLAEITRLRDTNDNSPELATFADSEVFETPEAAREWIEENGVSLNDYPEYVLNDYRD